MSSNLPITCLCPVSSVVAEGVTPYKLAVGSADNRIILFDHQQQEGAAPSIDLLQIENPFSVFENGSNITGIFVSNESNFVISSASDGQMAIIDLKKCAVYKKFEAHEKSLDVFAISSDNRQIITSGHDDHKLKLFNTLGECKYTFGKTHADEVITCIKFNHYATFKTAKGGSQSNDDVWCVAANKDGDLRIFSSSLKENLLRGASGSITGAINCVEFLPNDDSNSDDTDSSCFLVSGYENGYIQIWDLKKKELLNRLKNVQDIPRQILFAGSSVTTSGAPLLIIVCDTKIVIYDSAPLLISGVTSEDEDNNNEWNNNKSATNPSSLDPTTTEVPLYEIDQSFLGGEEGCFVNVVKYPGKEATLFCATSDGSISLIDLGQIVKSDGREDRSAILQKLFCHMRYTEDVITE